MMLPSFRPPLTSHREHASTICHPDFISAPLSPHCCLKHPTYPALCCCYTNQVWGCWGSAPDHTRIPLAPPLRSSQQGSLAIILESRARETRSCFWGELDPARQLQKPSVRGSGDQDRQEVGGQMMPVSLASTPWHTASVQRQEHGPAMVAPVERGIRVEAILLDALPEPAVRSVDGLGGEDTETEGSGSTQSRPPVKLGPPTCQAPPTNPAIGSGSAH